MLKIAIVKQCSDKSFWYSELVGFPELARFEIVDETTKDYIVKIENKFYNWELGILKTDCLAIEK